jgi:hypothetical protein
MVQSSQKLSNLQLELIKLFSFNLDDYQVIEIKDILAKYFAEKATNEMDRLWKDKNWTNEIMDNWSNENLRTSYQQA